MHSKEYDEILKDVIEKLCKQQGDFEEEVIRPLQLIYQENNGQKYRHKYSKITDTILNVSRNYGQEQTLMIISQNLRVLEEKIENKNTDEFKIQFAKLYDHINLECIRLRDFDNKINEVKDVAAKESEKLQKKYEGLESNLNKQQTQYITILGIFASIVLAFVGGFVFSSSVLSNIDEVSIYRLVFVIAFIALFFGNLLHQLFNFLLKITSRTTKEEKSISGKSLFFILI